MNTLPLQLIEGTSGLFEQIGELIQSIREIAGKCDSEAVFPFESMAKLREAGLLMAPLPVEFGGLGLYGESGVEALFHLLHLLGYADLAIGRIFEAHVNAIEMVRRYGTAKQMESAALAARTGDLFALWVTDPSENELRLSPAMTLSGEKWFCSAAGAAAQALVTAKTEMGSQMLLVECGPGMQVTHRGVKLAGMRAATTGSVDLTGMTVTTEALIGAPGDYLREPVFSTGAWRSSAVALGGLAALIETAKRELRSKGRSDQPFQQMRFGQAIIAHETGRLWISEAVQRIESATGAGEDAVAYVNLARTAVESACMDALHLMQRSLGISAFLQGSLAERIARDLATYLRQPAPDEALSEAAGYFMRHGVFSP